MSRGESFAPVPLEYRGSVSLLATAHRLGAFDPFATAALTAATVTWGPGIAAPYAAAAAREPARLAIIDDHGSITYRALHKRTSRLAAALESIGVDTSTTIGILCRNHRGFIECNIAAAKAGARTVYLNTSLPESQLGEVVRRESITVVLGDHEFQDLDLGDSTRFVLVAPEGNPHWSVPELPTSLHLGRRGPRRTPDPVLLTSGTSGAPKGTNRSTSLGALIGAIGFLDAVPYRRGDVVAVPAPLFHAWGLSQMILASTLAGTVVLRRHFDPEQTLRDLETKNVNALAAVPVMLRRILDVVPDRPVVLPALRIVATSGSALPGELSTEWMDTFGDTLHNLYGSTEVGQVTVANPDDLRAAPGTAGRPLRGVDLRLVDDDGDDVSPGKIGRIVVASDLHFDGYTDGGTKEVLDGHMSIGDLGRMVDGRLHVVGRADDMIISGGENLYPSNIEAALLDHPKVREATVVGVDDDDLGQRVRAVIVADRPHGKKLATSIDQHVRRALARYEVPREYVIVDELPRNGAGKVLRRQLNDPRTKTITVS